MRIQNLKAYSKPTYLIRGKNIIFEALWILLFKPIVSSFLPGSKWRKIILKSFGAKIGKSVRFNPGLKIKMPWKLFIGDNSWIGEETWIDNIAQVNIAENVCISQGVYLCTGNHDFKKSSFDLICSPINIESNVWVGAKSIIGPGYKIGCGSVITIGSIIKKDIPPNCIFKNNNCLKLQLDL